MKAMAILAVLVGALEAFNVTSEVIAGARAGRAAPMSLLLGVAALAALLLLAGGVALLVRGRSATRFAGAAALFFLLVFAGIAAFSHVFSIGSSVLAIGSSIALLGFLYRDSSQRPSAATR